MSDHTVVEPANAETFARFVPNDDPVTVVVVLMYPNLLESLTDVAVTLTLNAPDTRLVTLSVNVVVWPAPSDTGEGCSGQQSKHCSDLQPRACMNRLPSRYLSGSEYRWHLSRQWSKPLMLKRLQGSFRMM